MFTITLILKMASFVFFGTNFRTPTGEAKSKHISSHFIRHQILWFKTCTEAQCFIGFVVFLIA